MYSPNHLPSNRIQVHDRVCFPCTAYRHLRSVGTRWCFTGQIFRWNKQDVITHRYKQCAGPISIQLWWLPLYCNTHIHASPTENSAKLILHQHAEKVTAYCYVALALKPAPAHHLINDQPVMYCRKGCCSLGNLFDCPFSVSLVTNIYGFMLKQCFFQKQVGGQGGGKRATNIYVTTLNAGEVQTSGQYQ